MVYLDPHYAQPTVRQQDFSLLTREELSSYKCKTFKSISIEQLDPSMVIGFLLKEGEVDLFYENLNKSGILNGETPLFSIQDHSVDFSDVDFLEECFE